MVVALTTVSFEPAKPPKVTAVAPRKPVPVMVTLVPPDVGPAEGEREVTVGALAVKAAETVSVAP